MSDFRLALEACREYREQLDRAIKERAEARARLEQKINDAADFVEGMIIMERVRAARGFAESVDVMGLLNAIQNEIRRPIVCVEETK